MYWVYNKREVNKVGFYVLGIQQKRGKQSWIYVFSMLQKRGKKVGFYVLGML